MGKITAAITGVGQYLPEYILTNDELSRMVDTNDEWIMSHTGIKTRHILKGEGIGSSYMGARAVINLLDTIVIDNLPKKLERLNLSFNRYKGDLQIKKKSIPYLKELDMSHNDLQAIYIHEALYRILLSYNDLTIACFNHENLRYLDISYNLHMPSEVCFEPTQIDTVIREGVAEGER